MSHPDLVPLLVTDRFESIRRFYVDDLGCEPIIEQDAYLQVRFGDEPDARELAFMRPSEDGPMADAPTYAGGLVLSVSVDDADTFHAHLVDRGIQAAEPTDKPWGWRSFMLPDPGGVTLDFFHAIADTARQDAAS